MAEIYYKDEWHEQETALLLKQMSIQSIQEDLSYGLLAYIIGSVYKAKHLKHALDKDGVDLDVLLPKLEVYSSSERAMIRFALQCFNGNIDNISLNDVMYNLDENNVRVIKQAIDLRY